MSPYRRTQEPVKDTALSELEAVAQRCRNGIEEALRRARAAQKSFKRFRTVHRRQDLPHERVDFAAEGFVKTAGAAFDGKKKNFGTAAMWAAAASSAQLDRAEVDRCDPPLGAGPRAWPPEDVSLF